MTFVSDNHKLLHVSEDLAKARLRIYKLEQRGAPDRLSENNKEWTFPPDMITHYDPTLKAPSPIIVRYRWIWRQLGRFFKGLQEQYGVYA